MRKHHRALFWLLLSLLLVPVYSGCNKTNQIPVIQSLKSDIDSVYVGDIVSIKCLAFDPDQDAITYQWLANGGIISGDGSRVSWVAPNTAGTYTVTATVKDNKEGYARASVFINVRLSNPQINKPPIIAKLATETSSVRFRDSIIVVCNASDPDGDYIRYQWSATDGVILGNSSSVVWIAPDKAGTYEITVIVSDVKDAVTKGKLQIGVLPNNPPVVKPLQVERTRVSLNKSVTIRCDASDPDNDKLAYTWTATGGELSGQGEEVIWTAVGQWGDRVIVTVVVSDEWGGETSRKLTLRIEKPG
jgi:hypothetical protein